VGAQFLVKQPASFCLCAALLALCPALFSCKKKAEKVLEEYTPLSKSAQELSSSAQWAYEIEGDRLSKKIDSFEAISKSIPLSPLAMAALEGGLPMRGVYPDLLGFENLDTSGIQGELLETTRAFCKAFIDYSKAEPGEDGQKASGQVDALFYAKTLFSLSLFFADTKEAGAFDAFVVGRPFVGDDLIEIPVRFSGQKDYLFCKLYPIMDKEAWKIQQIEIYKWEAKDGSGKTDRN
jgi:hypothetical protein